jgi:uncharacterized DUF497 family protein
VDYEWDPSKARLNVAKHRVRFGDAVAVFEDERALTVRDLSFQDEDRWITVGQDVLGRVVVVVYEWRGENLRVISARLATPRELEQYLENR